MNIDDYSTEIDTENTTDTGTDMDTAAVLRAKKRRIAREQGRDDPLGEAAYEIETTGFDPLQLWEVDGLPHRGVSPPTEQEHRRSIKQWREHMTGNNIDRPAAAPRVEHVVAWIHHLRDERGISSGTIRQRLRHINAAYESWQRDPDLAYPTDHNPFQAARDRVTLDRDTTPKDPHPIEPTDLGAFIDEHVTNVRDRALIVLQLKCGLRSGEVSNIHLQDLHIDVDEIREHYDDFGTHPALRDRDEELIHRHAIHIPPGPHTDRPVTDTRQGNKSKRGRALPLDDETARIIAHYLYVRPDVDDRPWLFLSTANHAQLDTDKDPNRIWQKYFTPERGFGETERHRRVTSHYGRHYFTTWWDGHENLPREYGRYMRGDLPGEKAQSEAMDVYTHIHASDVVDIYLDRVFKLRI